MKVRVAVTATPAPPRAAPLLFFGDLAGAFRQAAALGADGVEIHMASAADVDVRSVRKLSAEYGLGIPALGTGMAAGEGLSLSHPDSLVRGRTVERVRGHIDFAAEVGSAIIIGSLSGRLGPGSPGERRARRSRAIEALAEVCDWATAAGITVFLEALNRYESDWINTLADAAAVASEIAAPNLGLLADTFHMNIEEANMAAALGSAGALTGHVHFADTNRRTPGYGHLDVPGIIKALDAIDYHGWVSLEVLPLPNAAQAARDGIETIRAALKTGVRARQAGAGGTS